VSTEAEEAFWRSPERQKALVEVSRTICERTRTSPEQFDEFVSGVSIPRERRPRSRTIRRLHAGEQKTVKDPVAFSGWLVGLNLFLNQGARREAVGEDVIVTLDGLNKDFQAVIGTTAQSLIIGGSRPPPTAAQWTAFSALLRQYLYIREEDLYAVRECFFGERAPDGDPREEAFFNMYRYHSNGGYIAKSFTSVLAPTQQSHMCTFANFFQDRSAALQARRANGVILPMGNVLHFIGEMDHGKALKFMTIERTARPQKWYEGLVLSFDGYREPIAARFVMRRTEASRFQDAGIGIVDEEAIAEEIAEFRDELRNSPTSLPDPSLYGKFAVGMYAKNK
jgi:hypothetical protein